MENFLKNRLNNLGKRKYAMLFAFVYSILLTVVAFVIENIVYHNAFLINDTIKYMVLFYILGLMAAKSSIKYLDKK